MRMRMVLLVALSALGIGLTGMGDASAAKIGTGIDDAARNSSPIVKVRGCRMERVCEPGGRNCQMVQVCR
jgi:hypothetical protein